MLNHARNVSALNYSDQTKSKVPSKVQKQSLQVTDVRVLITYAKLPFVWYGLTTIANY